MEGEELEWLDLSPEERDSWAETAVGERSDAEIGVIIRNTALGLGDFAIGDLTNWRFDVPRAAAIWRYRRRRRRQEGQAQPN